MSNIKNYIYGYTNGQSDIITDDDGTEHYQMCFLYDLVYKFISWSPSIKNKYNGLYLMNKNGERFYCPTYEQIRKSENISVTLYTKYTNGIYSDGTVYKFNGEIGQFPKLKLVGEYESDDSILDTYSVQEKKFVENYDLKSLVRIKDVLGIYVPHKITIQFIDTVLNSNYKNNINISDNMDFVEYNSYENISNLIYTMTSGTSFVISISYLAFNDWNSFDIKTFKYSYNGNTYNYVYDLTKNFQDININDIEKDTVVTITASKKTLYQLSVSSEDGIIMIDSYKGIYDYSKLKYDYSYYHEIEKNQTSGYISTTYTNPNTLQLLIWTEDYTAYPKFNYKINQYNEKTTDSSAYTDSSTITFTNNVPTIKNHESGFSYPASGGYYYNLNIKKMNLYKYNSLWIQPIPKFEPITVNFISKIDSNTVKIKIYYDSESGAHSGFSDFYYTLSPIQFIIDEKIKSSLHITIKLERPSLGLAGIYYILNTDIYKKFNMKQTLKTESPSYQEIYDVDLNIDTESSVKNINIYFYLSTIAVSKITLNRKNSEIQVYNNYDNPNTNIFDSTDSSVYITSTTYDQNNDKVSFNIIAYEEYNTKQTLETETTSISTINNITLKSNKLNICKHDTLQYRWIENGLNYDSSIVSLINNQYTFIKDGLTSNSEYILEMKTYKKYINKKINIIWTTANSISINTSSDGITKDESVSTITYDMTSGTIIGFKFSSEKNTYSGISGTAVFYTSDSDIKKYYSVTVIFSKADGESIGIADMEFDCSGINEFENSTKIDLSLTPNNTDLYTYILRWTSDISIGIINLDSPSDTTAISWVKNNTYNTSINYTTYKHPNEVGLRIEPTETNVYRRYKYILYDNSLKTADSSIKNFLFDSTGKKYDTYYITPYDISTYGSGLVFYSNEFIESIAFLIEKSNNNDKCYFNITKTTGKGFPVYKINQENNNL